MENIIIENLSFTYPDNTRPTLNNISLRIAEGEFIVLCGKSGCGKTTLLRHLKPLICPIGTKKGSIYIGERDINDLSLKEQATRIGYVMQNPESQIVCDKVMYEMSFGLENLGYSSDEIRCRVSETASFFGLQNIFTCNTSKLSGGQKQLLNLASVMAMQPSVLILDEPTSQLDPIAAHNFLDTLSKINKELGITIILSEHRLEEVIPICDRMIVMDCGEVISDNTPRNTGGILDELSSPMMLAMPVATRIYYSTNSKNNNTPITVREGRIWLKKQNIKNKAIVESEIEFKNSDVVLELKNVWYRYEKNSNDIIKNLSMKLHKGEFYALLGGNGTGKTSTLSIITGNLKPYSGKIKIANGKIISALPQKPDDLFVKNTVYNEIWEAFDRESKNDNHISDRIDEIATLCELKELYNVNPFDLSGGEKQRLALAKVLLTEPDILIMDEPTKGLDAEFKIKMAAFFKRLLENGISIMMASHDIEFCAMYADRVGMCFDGEIVSEGSTRKFFADKSFYTTNASKVARGIISDAILCDDIIHAIGGNFKNYDVPSYDTRIKMRPENVSIKSATPQKKHKLKLINILAALVFIVGFGIMQHYFCDDIYNPKAYLRQIASITCLGIGVFILIPKRHAKSVENQTLNHKKHIEKRTVISAIIICILIPITIYFGISKLSGEEYYFISTLLILESFIPFVISFDGKSRQSRELVLIAVICAIGVAGRLAFTALPQFKPVTALIIITAAVFGAETGFVIGSIIAFVSNFYFGQGIWTIWQMFAFGMVGFTAGLIFRNIQNKSRLKLSIFGFFAVFIVYGGIINPSSYMMFTSKLTWSIVIKSYILALPYDLVHAVSTVFFLWFASEAMIMQFERIKKKYKI